MIADAIRRLVDGQSLDRASMYAVFASVMDGEASDALKSALLVALRMKGESAEEITGAAQAMRERVTPLDTGDVTLVDTCGTGGDGRGTFNVSTIAALVAAGAGATVAKHGNRAVSSACGSADLLSHLGVRIDLDAGQTAAVLRRAGIAFLFAPRLHPAMSAVAAIRRELGIRTIFNILGPLTNPAFARRQVLGVYREQLVPVVADVLRMLGAEHALVVHSRDGLDEISVSAPTLVCELKDGVIQSYELAPDALGLTLHSIESVQGGTVAENASIAAAILDGEQGAPLDLVLANAAAAIYVAGLAPTIREGVSLARRSVESGSARARLRALIEASNEVSS